MQASMPLQNATLLKQMQIMHLQQQVALADAQRRQMELVHQSMMSKRAARSEKRRKKLQYILPKTGPMSSHQEQQQQEMSLRCAPPLPVPKQPTTNIIPKLKAITQEEKPRPAKEEWKPTKIKSLKRGQRSMPGCGVMEAENVHCSPERPGSCCQKKEDSDHHQEQPTAQQMRALLQSTPPAWHVHRYQKESAIGCTCSTAIECLVESCLALRPLLLDASANQKFVESFLQLLEVHRKASRCRRVRTKVHNHSSLRKVSDLFDLVECMTCVKSNDEIQVHILDKGTKIRTLNVSTCICKAVFLDMILQRKESDTNDGGSTKCWAENVTRVSEIPGVLVYALSVQDWLGSIDSERDICKLFPAARASIQSRMSLLRMEATVPISLYGLAEQWRGEKDNKVSGDYDVENFYSDDICIDSPQYCQGSTPDISSKCKKQCMSNSGMQVIIDDLSATLPDVKLSSSQPDNDITGAGGVKIGVGSNSYMIIEKMHPQRISLAVFIIADHFVREILPFLANVAPCEACNVHQLYQYLVEHDHPLGIASAFLYDALVQVTEGGPSAEQHTHNDKDAHRDVHWHDDQTYNASIFTDDSKVMVPTKTCDNVYTYESVSAINADLHNLKKRRNDGLSQAVHCKETDTATTHIYTYDRCFKNRDTCVLCRCIVVTATLIGQAIMTVAAEEASLINATDARLCVQKSMASDEPASLVSRSIYDKTYLTASVPVLSKHAFVVDDVRYMSLDIRKLWSTSTVVFARISSYIKEQQIYKPRDINFCVTSTRYGAVKSCGSDIVLSPNVSTIIIPTIESISSVIKNTRLCMNTMRARFARLLARSPLLQWIYDKNVTAYKKTLGDTSKTHAGQEFHFAKLMASIFDEFHDHMCKNMGPGSVLHRSDLHSMSNALTSKVSEGSIRLDAQNGGMRISTSTESRNTMSMAFVPLLMTMPATSDDGRMIASMGTYPFVTNYACGTETELLCAMQWLCQILFGKCKHSSGTMFSVYDSNIRKYRMLHTLLEGLSESHIVTLLSAPFKIPGALHGAERGVQNQRRNAEHQVRGELVDLLGTAQRAYIKRKNPTILDCRHFSMKLITSQHSRSLFRRTAMHGKYWGKKSDADRQWKKPLGYDARYCIKLQTNILRSEARRSIVRMAALSQKVRTRKYSLRALSRLSPTSVFNDPLIMDTCEIQKHLHAQNMGSATERHVVFNNKDSSNCSLFYRAMHAFLLPQNTRVSTSNETLVKTWHRLLGNVSLWYTHRALVSVLMQLISAQQEDSNMSASAMALDTENVTAPIESMTSSMWRMWVHYRNSAIMHHVATSPCFEEHRTMVDALRRDYAAVVHAIDIAVPWKNDLYNNNQHTEVTFENNAMQHHLPQNTEDMVRRYCDQFRDKLPKQGTPGFWPYLRRMIKKWNRQIAWAMGMFPSTAASSGLETSGDSISVNPSGYPLPSKWCMCSECAQYGAVKYEAQVLNCIHTEYSVQMACPPLPPRELALELDRDVSFAKSGSDRTLLPERASCYPDVTTPVHYLLYEFACDPRISKTLRQEIFINTRVDTSDQMQPLSTAQWNARSPMHDTLRAIDESNAWLTKNASSPTTATSNATTKPIKVEKEGALRGMPTHIVLNLAEVGFTPVDIDEIYKCSTVCGATGAEDFQSWFASIQETPQSADWSWLDNSIDAHTWRRQSNFAAMDESMLTRSVGGSLMPLYTTAFVAELMSKMDFRVIDHTTAVRSKETPLAVYGHSSVENLTEEAMRDSNKEHLDILREWALQEADEIMHPKEWFNPSQKSGGFSIPSSDTVLRCVASEGGNDSVVTHVAELENATRREHISTEMILHLLPDNYAILHMVRCELRNKVEDSPCGTHTPFGIDLLAISPKESIVAMNECLPFSYLGVDARRLGDSFCFAPDFMNESTLRQLLPREGIDQSIQAQRIQNIYARTRVSPDNHSDPLHFVRSPAYGNQFMYMSIIGRPMKRVAAVLAGARICSRLEELSDVQCIVAYKFVESPPHAYGWLSYGDSRPFDYAAALKRRANLGPKRNNRRLLTLRTLHSSSPLGKYCGHRASSVHRRGEKNRRQLLQQAIDKRLDSMHTKITRRFELSSGEGHESSKQDTNAHHLHPHPYGQPFAMA